MPQLKYLGMICDKSTLAWALIETDDAGRLVNRNKVSAPPNSSREAQLHWLFREVEGILDSTTPDKISLKRAESAGSASDAILEHAEMDGALLAAAGSKGYNVERLKWVTVGTRLGAPSRKTVAAIAMVEGTKFVTGVAKTHFPPIAVALASSKS